MVGDAYALAIAGHHGGLASPSAVRERLDRAAVVEAATVVDRGDHIRLELRARDQPDLAMWAAERNGDLFELEFGRRIRPVAVEVTKASVRR